MESKIRDIVEKYKLNESVSVVAVSGGIDSMVLLELLQKKKLRNNLVVAHFNHGLRNDSIHDEELVKKVATRLGLEFISGRSRVKKTDESTLRKIRYSWLREVQKQKKAKFIITAHHLDDQIETILLKLIRGSGPLEMWGMRELAGGVLRPLLSTSKQDINSYARIHNLSYREDQSNKDINYARNRIRLNVIAELEKINPSLRKTLLPNIRLAEELRSYVNTEVSRLEKRARENNKIKLAPLKKADSYLVKELIKKVLSDQLGGSKEIYSKNIDEVFGLLNKAGTKRTSILGLLVTKDYEWLSFGAKEIPITSEAELILGKELAFNGHRLRAYLGNAGVDINNILLPAEFSDSLMVRVWKEGDKIKTALGTKKLQDIFVDAKISQDERKSWPVVTSRDQILWVPRLAASYHAGPKNKNIIIEVK